MWTNLFIGTGVMMLCLLFQCVLLVAALRFYVNHQTWLRSPRMVLRVLLLMAAMVFLVGGNLLQISVWALIFFALGEFSDFATAFYHSSVNFATLGYGDVVMSEHWRLLGPLESLNGIVMVGVSTAALLRIFQDIFKVVRGELEGTA